MAGGPSHLETFDYKPKLAEMHGQPMPESFTKGQPIAQLQGQQARLLRAAASLQEVRQARPGDLRASSRTSARVADEICIIRSLVTEAINHDPAHTFMNTGTTISGRPGMGSWVTYGLGSESDNLPGFVVLTSTGQGGQTAADRRPAVAQRLSAQPVPGRRVPLQGRPGPLRQEPQRRQRRASSATWSTPCKQLNRARRTTSVDDPEIATRDQPVRDGLSDAGERARA